MKIAILGGTGNIGKGLALRWECKHEIIIGSREQSKAEQIADSYAQILRENTTKTCNIRGVKNDKAVAMADIVIVAVPYQALKSLVDSIQPSLTNQVIISLVVPMEKQNSYLKYIPPGDGSAAVELKKLVPDTVGVVAAFHNLSARKLCNLENRLDYDVAVCSSDKEAKKKVIKLIEDINGIRALDGGGLEDAVIIEALTPFLINLAKRNNLQELGVKFV
ncbi:MAG: F420-dependent NADP reductase [Candidatus Argoarchaeum ethanivorans]|uniref:F420-dependent NADP reductase n=1 Tax=Candidatus Argoarchaeum ethanivorans TaxID=2608793 RepID=A0A811T1S3_9EURY|nr:MAG: F420-dependent NADP reductase [Candidatus Argoarchaeum ethanivorans]